MFFSEGGVMAMSDDIVIRIRNHIRGDFVKTSEFLLGLAADEIERLRALLESIEDLHNWGSTDNPCCESCSVWPCKTHLLLCGECRGEKNDRLPDQR